MSGNRVIGADLARHWHDSPQAGALLPCSRVMCAPAMSDSGWEDSSCFSVLVFISHEPAVV